MFHSALPHASAVVFHAPENRTWDFFNVGYDAACHANVGYDGSEKSSSAYDAASPRAQTDNSRRTEAQRASFAPFSRLLAAESTGLRGTVSAFEGPGAMWTGENVPVKYHYTTSADSSFSGGLRAQSSVTDKLYTDPLLASQELGIPVPTRIIPILDRGYFKPNSPFIAQPSNRFIGGGTDFTNINRVPGSDILPGMGFGGL